MGSYMGLKYKLLMILVNQSSQIHSTLLVQVFQQEP